MIYNLNAIRKQFLGLPLSEAEFEVRGFALGKEAQARLEFVAKTVVNAYNIAVERGLDTHVEEISQSVKKELFGFFNEGIAMGLYTLDIVSLFNRDRFWKFVDGPGKKHDYMSFIGAGLAAGVFRRPFKKFIDKACPIGGCLILDGIGFYYAMFQTKKTLQRLYVPNSIKNNTFYQKRYDNGIGRALWFYGSGEPDIIAETIANFPNERQASIWSGVGLAASYARGVHLDKIRQLKVIAGPHALYVAQGAFMAAHTRHRAGNPHPDDTVERILTGHSSAACQKQAEKIRRFLNDRRIVDHKPSYQVFLELIREWLIQTEQSPKASNGLAISHPTEISVK